MQYHHVFVTCRDGTQLATDIYLPDRVGRFPTVVQRTPYGKFDPGCVEYAEWFTEHGYVGVVQDVRGRHDSSGTWNPYDNCETSDGYDTIDWITRQLWSDRTVGFAGSSYGAFTGLMAALSQHPALKALVTRVPASGLYHHHFYYGGIFSLARLWWATLVNRRIQQATTQDGECRWIFEKLISQDPKILEHLPVEEIGDRFAMPIPWWRSWLQHPMDDAYWQKLEILHQIDKLRIPIYHISGWHDDFCAVALENYSALINRWPNLSSTKHRLLMGMWPHALNIRTDHGGLEYGAEAVIDLHERERQWFDQWLRGTYSPLAEEPPVRLFIMGANEWRNSDTWPPSSVHFTPLYLQGDSRLSFEHPMKASSSQYTYDPRNLASPQPWDFGEPERPLLPGWQIDDREGDDRLVFRSFPLARSVTVVGPIRLRLFAASSARDTDWFAWVAWQEPELHTIRLLTYGYAIRARFRHGFSQSTLLTPGKVESYDIDLGATSRVLPEGARILCCIQSSCAPWFSRNLNTGENNYVQVDSVIAEQSIYHSRAYPSHVLLPILSDTPPKPK